MNEEKIWRSKYGTVRKKEIIGTALTLFCQKGFDNVSVNQIIAEIGISKGAFYYYFASKAQLLEQIIREGLEKIVEIVKSVAEDPNLDALTKLNKLAADMQQFKSLQADKNFMMFVLFRQRDMLVERKTIELAVQQTSVYYQKLVEQGIAEGTLNTAFPEQIAEFVTILRSNFDNYLGYLLLEQDKFAENLVLVKRKARFFQDALERILGAPPDSIRFAESVEKQLAYLEANFFWKKTGQAEPDQGSQERKL